MRFEDVQAQLDLAPVFAAVRTTEFGLLHLFAHNADATGSMTRAQGNRAEIAARLRVGTGRDDSSTVEVVVNPRQGA